MTLCESYCGLWEDSDIRSEYTPFGSISTMPPSVWTFRGRLNGAGKDLHRSRCRLQENDEIMQAAPLAVKWKYVNDLLSPLTFLLSVSAIVSTIFSPRSFCRCKILASCILCHSFFHLKDAVVARY